MIAASSIVLLCSYGAAEAKPSLRMRRSKATLFFNRPDSVGRFVRRRGRPWRWIVSRVLPPLPPGEGGGEGESGGENEAFDYRLEGEGVM